MNTNHPLAQETCNDPIICFVALPFGDKKEFPYDSVLLPALRMVLELRPYYWRVNRANDELRGRFIYENIDKCLKCADVYIADISDLNYNVMMEFGYMHWTKQPVRPLIVLERTASKATLPEYKDLADIQGLIRTPYTVDASLLVDSLKEYAKDQLVKHFKKSFGDNPEMQKMSKIPRLHYLSPLWIEEQCRYDDKEMTRVISNSYTTMEAFRDAIKKPTDRATTMEVRHVAEELSSLSSSKIPPVVIQSILEEVIAVLQEDHR